MENNVFETEVLDLASKLDAVTSNCGKIVQAASAVVKEQNSTATIYLIRKISAVIDSEFTKNEIKHLAISLKDSIMKYYGYRHIMEVNTQMHSQTDEDSRSLTDLLKDLDGLIGLEKVKSKVKDLISYQKVQLLRQEYGLRVQKSTLHMAFTGNPGTGKTTVARIVGRIYKQLGLLSKGQFLEVSRTDLIAGYQGQTALKVKKVIEQAKGGVLFIDEAYSITENDHTDSYGRECLTELTKALEDYRDDLVVIVAGYTEPMMNFFESNPGLRSRFNTFIEFDDYSADELEHILESICQQNDYQLDHALQEKLILYFNDKVAAKDKNFANGRLARNLYDDLVMNHARRVVSSSHPNRQELSLLIAEDFQPVSSLSDKETPASAAT